MPIEMRQHSATTSTRMNPVKGANGSDDTARSCSVSGGHAGVQQPCERVGGPPCPPEPAAGAWHVVLHLHPGAVTLRVPAPTCAQLSLCVPVIFCLSLISVLAIPIILPSQQASASQEASVICQGALFRYALMDSLLRSQPADGLSCQKPLHPLCMACNL